MRYLLATFILLIGGFFLYLAYYGAFISVEIEEGEVGPYHLVYKEHKGAYENIQNTIEIARASLYRLKPDAECTGFGIYYDNPSQVETQNLRSIGGCIVSAGTDFTPAADMQGIKTHVYDKTVSISAEFPLKDDTSIMLAVFKVYPEIRRYQKENNLSPQPVLEIYDRKNNLIRISQPLKKK